jgi:hypothetical protein
VLSFRDLPPGLAHLRGRARLQEIDSPLGLFELKAALPRAYYVPSFEVASDPGARSRRLADPGFDPSRVVLLWAMPVLRGAADAGFAGPAHVAYQRVDAHTVRVIARTPPGLLVVLDGYHRDWVADEHGAPVALLPANDRYRAVVTAGGERVFTMRFRPSWPGQAFVAAAVGLGGVMCLLVIGCVRFHRTASVAAC